MFVQHLLTRNPAEELTDLDNLGQVHPVNGVSITKLTASSSGATISLDVVSMFSRQNQTAILNQERWFISTSRSSSSAGQQPTTSEFHVTYEDVALLPAGSWLKCSGDLPLGASARHFKTTVTAYLSSGAVEHNKPVYITLDSCDEFATISRIIWNVEIKGEDQPVSFAFEPATEGDLAEIPEIPQINNRHCYYGGTNCNQGA